jgi:hypothetical protein
MVEGLNSGQGGGGNGVAFLVSAGVMYEIIAAACSSPQTAELNAAARSDTLMKWVNLGVAQGVLFVGVAAAVDQQHRAAILAGAITAAGLLYWQYVYALRCGLRSSLPGTENYSAPGTPPAVNGGSGSYTWTP